MEISYNRVFAGGDVLGLDFSEYDGVPGFKIMISLDGKVINDALDDLQKRQETSGYSGVPSGFPSIDDITLGWQPSDLIILAARPSVGKTAFVVNVARNAAVDFNMPVAIFSLEMPAKQLANRMMVSETGLGAEKIKGGVKLQDWEWQQLDIQLKRLSKAPIYIDDTPSLPVMEFRSKVKKLVKQICFLLIFKIHQLFSFQTMPHHLPLNVCKVEKQLSNPIYQ